MVISYTIILNHVSYNYVCYLFWGGASGCVESIFGFHCLIQSQNADGKVNVDISVEKVYVLVRLGGKLLLNLLVLLLMDLNWRLDRMRSNRSWTGWNES